MNRNEHDQLMGLILTEIRQNRQEIQELRKEIWSLKARFMLIAMSFGLAGGKISQVFSFLG